MFGATGAGPKGERVFLVVVALLVLATRLPFLAPALEDIDSINFDRGIHDYDPSAHQPHPPGYPVYIALAKLPHGWFASHATGIAVVSAFFSALAVIPLYLLLRDLTTLPTAGLACLLTLFNPLVWFNGVRPMSDLVGFFFATTAQWLTVRSFNSAPASAWVPAAVAGLAAGVRIQTLLLTVPLLAVGCFRERGRTAGTALGLSLGVAVWLGPLVVTLGGPTEIQAAFLPVVGDTLMFESIASRFSARAAASALHDTAIGPWQSPWLAAAVLLLAAAGLFMLARSKRRTLALLCTLFAFYGIYHLLVQDVQTLRYVIPVTPLVATLAAVPIATMWCVRPVAAGGLTLALLAAAATSTVPALMAYRRTPSPATQAVQYVNANATKGDVVTGHYVFDRYLPLVTADLEQLRPVQEREWQTLARFWRSGRRETVWFLKEPRRMTLLLFGRDAQQTVRRWSWPAELQSLLQGARPGTVELVKMTAPLWLPDKGFMARFEERFSGLESGIHRVELQPGKEARVFIASGALAAGHETADISLRARDAVVMKTQVGREFSLHTLLPRLAGDTYVPVTLESSTPFIVKDVFFERAGRHVIRPGPGFHLVEHDEAGQRFRWTTERARASVYLPAPRARLIVKGRAPRPIVLPISIRLEWNGAPLAAFDVDQEEFSYETELLRGDSDWGELTIAPSSTFVPDELSGNGDQRVLGVRIHQLRLSFARVTPTRE